MTLTWEMTNFVGLFPVSRTGRSPASSSRITHPFTEAAMPPSTTAVSARWRPVPGDPYLISIGSFLSSAIPHPLSGGLPPCPRTPPPLLAEPRPHEDVPELSHQRRWWILLVVSLSMLMGVLDGTIVNIALPSAQHDLTGLEVTALLYRRGAPRRNENAAPVVHM